MIDKLDIRVPRHTVFAPSFARTYRELRAMEKGPFRQSKHYEYAGDLREFGHNLRLNLYCQMDKIGNHKIELLDVGLMTRSEIILEITRVFDIDPYPLGVMREDLAVDVPGTPVQWFRETVHVQHKRFRSAVTGERFFSEMGTGGIQTLYFGKRPNLIRIYDKTAEYKQQYQSLKRKMGRGFEGTFESVFPGVAPDSILTRVERQIGGRVPVEVNTLSKLLRPDFAYRPFERLRIVDHAPSLDCNSSLSFETYCTAELLRRVAQDDGMQAVKELVSKRSHGNSGWVWKKYGPMIASLSSNAGITSAELQSRFEGSIRRQMSD